MDRERPKLLCSKCLGFGKCRYNGAVIPAPFVRKMGEFCDIITVCPEMEIGLGVPRNPVRIISNKGNLRLVQPETGMDISGEMEIFCRSFFDELDDVHGFLLKYKSPSCGLFASKYFSGAEERSAAGSGPGFFGRAVFARYPGYPAETEKRLINFAVRDHFLTKLFLFAEFARIKRRPEAARLVDFQARNKLMLLAHHQKNMRKMGRMVAAWKELGLEKTISEYESLLLAAFRERASHRSHINVLQHAAGYFSKNISRDERNYISNLVTKYKEKKIPLSAIRAVIRSYIIRFDIEYLKEQTYFDPYPEELVEVTDSGKGRDLKHI